MSDCKHEFLEIENNDLFLQCTKCGAWIEINEYPLHEAEQRIKDLGAQLAEATSIVAGMDIYIEAECHEAWANNYEIRESAFVDMAKKLKQLKEK